MSDHEGDDSRLFPGFVLALAMIFSTAAVIARGHREFFVRAQKGRT